MGQKIASLEIELLMATGQAVSDLVRFGGVVDKTSMESLKALDRIDAAMKGIGDMSGPTGSMVKFAGEISKSAVDAAREFNRIEKAGESLSAQLDRQIGVYGKTTAEIRSMKVETAALAAEQQGQAELAGRLRQQEADLYAMEFAAARKAQQAAEELAETRAANAAAAVQAAEREATAVREAAHAYQMFEAAARNGAAAMREAEAAAKSDAFAAEATRVREAAAAFQMFEARAREGVAAMRAADAAAAEFEQMISRVTNRVDPAATALGRLKTELEEAKTAFDAGRIGAEAFAQEQSRVAAAAGGLYGPQRKLAGAIEEVGTAQRFTASETLNLSRQFQDIGVTAAMGMNPLMILAQQGPQIYDVLEQAKARGVGAAGAFAQMGKDIMGYAVTGLSKLATFITPVNVLLAGTASVAIGAVRSLGIYDDALKRFETTAAGLGRVSGQTAQQLETISEAAAVAGERSIGATRDSVNAFAAAGIQGEQTLTSLASIVDKYATLTGQTAPAAQTALAEAMKDPARAADTFTQQLGLLTGAQYEHIKQLAAQGDQEQAAAEITRILTGDIAANTHEVTGLAHYMEVLGGAVSGVASWFGRLDQKIRAAGASYDAWLKQHVGSEAVNLFGTGNQAALTPNPNAARDQDQIAALNASQAMNTSGMKQYNDLLAQQSVLQKGLANTTGLTSIQIQALRHDYSAVTDTIYANRDASGAWITTQERSHLIAVAQDKLAAAHTQREKAAAQQTITRLQLGTQVLTQQERQTQATDAYNKVSDKYSKGDQHAAELAREAAAIAAQTKNLYALAEAYGVSGAAALIAEAREKAESQAIKQRGDVDAAVARQVRLAIAQRVADAAKSTASLRDQAAIQAQVNAAVAAGTVPATRAADLLRDRIADLPLLAALEAARQIKDAKGAAAAEQALDDQRVARDRLTDAERKAGLVAAIQTGGDQLATLREELRLVGATDAARVHALATLKAEQEVTAAGWGGPDAANYVRQQVEIADAQQAITDAQNKFNESLGYSADLFDAIDQSAGRAAQGISEAFGSTGSAIGQALTSVTGYYATQARLEQAHRAAIKTAGADQQRIDRENSLYAVRTAGAQIGMYGDIADAAKGLFKEHSKGYKAMEDVEKAFRAVQLALSIQAMVQNLLETTDVVAKAAVKATAEGTAGVAKQSQLPFPANLVAMAATAAALIAAGVAVLGGGGHGTSAADYSKGNTGTGTVLGDPTAQSASIKNAIDALKGVDDVTLTVSRDMLTSLRSIETNIGGLASLLVRTGNIDASANITAGFKPGILGGLFGTKTKVTGSGIYGDSQSVGDILADGFDASYYSDVQKKKKLFGLTTSTKYKTTYTDADSEIEDQFTLILRQFYDAIGKAAGPLGMATSDVEAKLQGFVVDIGKIDLQGLSGTEIQDKLEAVFGAAADDMAKAGIPGLEQFQKVGEGYFETLVRVATTVEAVDATFQKLGATTSSLGIDVDMAVAGLFDSVSDFTDAAQTYFETYYSEAEQAAAKTAQLGKVFTSLGLTMPGTLADFRSLVEAQDLTTAAGQKTYATLLQLAPAFADLKTSMDGAKSAADILSEQRDLQNQLWQLQGNTAAIRAAQLASLDPSNRALQQQIYAIQDAQDAAKAADDLRQAWKSVGDSIMDEVNRIRGLSNTGTGGSFASLMGQFNAANSAARAGDMDAAKDLPQLSKSLLDAAALAATSRQELDRVQAQTAAALEATYAAIGGQAVDTSPSSGATAAMLSTLSASQATSETTATDSGVTMADLRKEVSDMSAKLTSALAQIASNTSRSARTLDNVTAASGGEAVSVAGIAA